LVIFKVDHLLGGRVGQYSWRSTTPLDYRIFWWYS